MSKEFLLPELAESVVEGEIVKWLVSEGDEVEEDQPIVEVMTDKVTVELPSPYAGVLEKQLVQEGDVVPVHAPIARFADEATADERTDQETDTRGADTLQAAEERSIVEPGGAEEEDDGASLSLFKPSGDIDDGPVVQVRRGNAPAQKKREKVTGPYGRVLAVPAARKLARDEGIEIGDVSGSGPNGRIRIADVRAHLEKAGSSPQAPRAEYRSPEGYEALEERVPVRGLRRAISKQMLASHLQSVRTLHVDEADVTNLVALRERLKPLAERRGAKLSYLPFIMKAVVAALKAFPMLNSSLDEAEGDIVMKGYYNLGLAVATEAGLVVPVVHGVDRRGLLELAEAVSSLATKAKANKLAPEDVGHGTFSITNIGSLGGLFSFPIINVPEAAILGVHSIKKRPVVMDDDTIVARQMLYLSLSFDHRIIDGAEAAMFTSYLIELLETPESLMLEA